MTTSIDEETMLDADDSAWAPSVSDLAPDSACGHTSEAIAAVTALVFDDPDEDDDDDDDDFPDDEEDDEDEDDLEDDLDA